MTHLTCTGCPVLRAAAMMQGLLDQGIMMNGYDPAGPLVIGHLRAEHGCPGPVGEYSRCYWSVHLIGAQLAARPDVPLVKPTAPGRNTGQYV